MTFEIPLIFILLFLALLAGYLWILEQKKSQALKEEVVSLKKDLNHAQERNHNIQDLSHHFKALSSDVLKQTTTSFLDLAQIKLEKFQEGAKHELGAKEKAIDALLKPLKETLQQVDKKIGDLDKGYSASYLSLVEQMKGMGMACAELNKQTANLTKALRAPHVRGRWGEIQLKRVVELSGMVAYCDFYEQQVNALKMRPDLVVRLPNSRQIIVDAKTPIHAYLEAIEAPDDAIRLTKMKDHARHVRTHIEQLSSKTYWEQFENTPEFVVLFIPGESFFSAALEQDPTLIEVGVEQKVILATPTTLIALLKSVAYGWRQEALALNSQEIVTLGKELFSRLSKVTEHFNALRKGLETAVEGYNKAMSSFETRVLVTARKFNELEVAVDEELQNCELIEKLPRPLLSATSSESNLH